MKYLGVAFLLFLVACGGPANRQPAPASVDSVPPVPLPPFQKDTSSLGGTWYLEPVPPSDTAAGNVPWIHFALELNRFNGYTGCNPMHGKFYFSTADSSISFGEKTIVGRKFCKGYNEAGFLKNLQNTGRYRLQNGVLMLMMDNHTELSRWRRGKSVQGKTTVT